MPGLAVALLLLAGSYLGWNIGANDSANCAGAAVGSRLLSYRRAMGLVAAFAILGALLGSAKVVETVGKGIVAAELPWQALLVAMGSAGLCVTLATVFRLPVSTSQAIVGALIGIGLAAGAPVNLSVISGIVGVWAISPALALVLSFILYHLVALLLRSIRRSGVLSDLLNWLILASAAYAAFSLGANNIGNAIGPLANLGLRSGWITLLGGLALGSGALTYGQRVTETVARGVVPLDPLSAFATQTAIALVGHGFAFAGIPISISQAVVGALAGIGLVKGVRTVSYEMLVAIAIGWVGTPAVAGLLAYGLWKLIA
ncbi:MAG: anion permease [Candidatus Acetothermia bacterium]|jgi:PiT family inorganic phosphate transporter|nr:anion permease [Candidatus Acetothermia bacterium]MDH7504556.1 inorganic phosphate transporter [Candidatus Acetothermia bacterium]